MQPNYGWRLLCLYNRLADPRPAVGLQRPVEIQQKAYLIKQKLRGTTMMMTMMMMRGLAKHGGSFPAIIWTAWQAGTLGHYHLFPPHPSPSSEIILSNFPLISFHTLSIKPDLILEPPSYIRPFCKLDDLISRSFAAYLKRRRGNSKW